ncbi:MAG: cadherin-like beta sandwich domain-containing protein [Clostridia bacterium]|nr:cadherin-like beta sandwich domain-containing protein [Clostridia bacterium]
MYNVSRTNSNIVVTSGNESEFIENTSTTIKYKATKVGTVSITVSASDMADLDNSSNKVTGSKTYTVTIKEKTNNSSSSGNSGNSNSSSSSGNNTTKTPTFKSANQKIYTTGDCNLRASWTTSSAATSVKKGTELTLTGTSTETIDGYTWYRVTYQGATKYIASSLITYTKPKEDDNKKDDEKSSNKNLSSLTIDGIEMTPTFNKDTTQYAAHVDGDVDELKINAKAEDSKAKVAIEGNKGLKEGDNIIKVKVTAEDETTRTYFITVTKGEGTEIDTKLKLTQLSIERVNFEDTFKPDTYSYELDLTSYVKNLDITAVPSQADATVDISGNEEFKEGQNVIVILLTSADGSETATYQIKVNVPAEVMEKAKEEENTTLYILIGIAVAVVIIAIIVIVRRHRASREDDYEDNFSEDEDKVEEVGRRRFSNYEERYRYQMEENDKEEEEERSSRTSRNSTLDDFLNPQDDDDDDDRKPRGRHSR